MKKDIPARILTAAAHRSAYDEASVIDDEIRFCMHCGKALVEVKYGD